MQFNWRQYNTMQYNEIPCNTLFRSFETSTRPKRVYFGCVWWPWVEPWRANRGQLGPNLFPQGPPRISEVPQRTFYGQNGPILPLFDRFLELGGSILKPHKHISKKNVPHKIGPWKFRAHGHFGLEGDLLWPPETQKGPYTMSKWVLSMSPTQAAQSGSIFSQGICNLWGCFCWYFTK